MLEIQFICLKNEEAIIELDIPLDFFKDITLIFVKKCSGTNSASFFSYVFAWLVWIMYWIFIASLFASISYAVYLYKFKLLPPKDVIPNLIADFNSQILVKPHLI